MISNNLKKSVTEQELTTAFEAYLRNTTLLPFEYEKIKIDSTMAQKCYQLSTENVKEANLKKYMIFKRAAQDCNIPLEVTLLILNEFCNLFSPVFFQNKLSIRRLINHLEIIEIIDDYIPSKDRLFAMLANRE